MRYFACVVTCFFMTIMALSCASISEMTGISDFDPVYSKMEKEYKNVYLSNDSELYISFINNYYIYKDRSFACLELIKNIDVALEQMLYENTMAARKIEDLESYSRFNRAPIEKVHISEIEYNISVFNTFSRYKEIDNEIDRLDKMYILKGKYNSSLRDFIASEIDSNISKTIRIIKENIEGYPAAIVEGLESKASYSLISDTVITEKERRRKAELEKKKMEWMATEKYRMIKAQMSDEFWRKGVSVGKGRLSISEDLTIEKIFLNGRIQSKYELLFSERSLLIKNTVEKTEIYFKYRIDELVVIEEIEVRTPTQIEAIQDWEDKLYFIMLITSQILEN